MPYSSRALGADDAPPAPGAALRAPAVAGTIAAGQSAVHLVNVCAPGRYHFSLCEFGGRADFDARLCLRDAAGNRIAVDDGACGGGSGDGVRLSVDVGPGEYAVSLTPLRGGSGSYALAHWAEAGAMCLSCSGRFLRDAGAIEPSLAVRTATGALTSTTADAYTFEVAERGEYVFETSGDEAVLLGELATWLCLLDSASSTPRRARSSPSRDAKTRSTATPSCDSPSIPAVTRSRSRESPRTAESTSSPTTSRRRACRARRRAVTADRSPSSARSVPPSSRLWSRAASDPR